ncbi:MAG TPA: hypothetical protein VIP56_12045 [Nitrososphaeraceae archaeon]
MSQEDILTKEIKLWKGFEYALREENRILFSKMLSECGENKDYVRAASSKGQSFAAESLFLALILQQQKMISQLIAKLASSLDYKRQK